MLKIRTAHVLVSFSLIAALFLAVLPAAPAFALALPAGGSGAATLSAFQTTAVSPATGARVYVKDRHVTIEQRGDLMFIHISEILVFVRDGKVVAERFVKYTIVQRR